MNVSEKDVSYVADLAKLDLTSEERSRMLRDLNSILAYIDRLDELDTSEISPMAQILSAVEEQESGSMRDDVREGLRQSLPHDEAMANAPVTDGTFFKVPKVIER
ncbi:MAG TPA: Asp-tRNA(Asn)/Glu-tRNA(Gln) amidotransferase subunit GatC [Terriglobales bacterium]|nr:Asp-tRNA(Asn)/Glu-tRNA(Gln) amidotransferase subunit GatC [Terriglobales bacterium]